MLSPNNDSTTSLTVKLGLEESTDNISYFFKLNQDCVLCIFSYLEIRDLIICERVSKFWRELSLKAWKSIKSLNLHPYFGSFGQPILSNHRLKSILDKSSGCLKILDLSQLTYQKLSPGYGDIIGKACPGLKVLNFSQLPVTDRELMSISEYCTHLKSLNLDKCANVCDLAIKSILDKCKKLKHLSLVKNVKITGACFSQRTENLKRLDISYCIGFDSENYAKLSQNSPCLEKFILDEADLSESSFITMCNSLERLAHISLNYSLVETKLAWTHLNKLKNLKYFAVNFNPTICSETFQALHDGSPGVVRIEVAGCKHDDLDMMVANISKCRQLEHIDLSHGEFLTNRGLLSLSKVSSLKTVILSACPRIDDAGIEQLLSGNHKLKHLDLRGCREVGQASATNIEQYFSSRGNHLMVLAGGSNIPNLFGVKKFDGLEFNMSTICPQMNHGGIFHYSEDSEWDDYFGSDDSLEFENEDDIFLEESEHQDELLLDDDESFGNYHDELVPEEMEEALESYQDEELLDESNENCYDDLHETWNDDLHETWNDDSHETWYDDSHETWNDESRETWND